ncbi:MAG: hypothetical protein JJE50_01595 [Actinomycetales bacterium]|nr:hypothetical protein [Actinomycetales bacterium]
MSSRTGYRRQSAADLRAALATRDAAIEARAQEVREARAAARAVEADRVQLTRADIEGATHVRDRWGWHRVVQVNAVTVTVLIALTGTELIPFTRVIEARR